VFEHDGIVWHGRDAQERGQDDLRQGSPSLPDPAGLFNSSLDGNTRRAIDFREGDKINEKAFKALIKAAVELNTAKRAAPPKKNAAKGAAK